MNTIVLDLGDIIKLQWPNFSGLMKRNVFFTHSTIHSGYIWIVCLFVQCNKIPQI